MAARQRRGLRWALLVLSGIVSASLSAQIKRPEGGEVILEANYTGDPTEINWKKDGNKVVDMELEPLYIYYYPVQGRATISPTDGSLTIRNLTVGDSGHYQAEALVDIMIQETHYDLTVIACPAEPTISDNSTKNQTELSCASKTPSVAYEWWNQTRLVAQKASYTANRTREGGTLTCVVYVDKDVCKNNASIIIPPIPDSSFPTWLIILLPFLVLIAVFCLVISILCYIKKAQVKKNRQQLNEDSRTQLFANGDLPIHNVTSADKGTYTAHHYNQAPQEEVVF